MDKKTKFMVTLVTPFGELLIPVRMSPDATVSELDAEAMKVLREGIPFTRYGGAVEVPEALL